MDASKLKALAEAHCKRFANVNKDPTHKDVLSVAKGYASFFNATSFTIFSPMGSQIYTSYLTAVDNMHAWLSGLSKVGIDPFRDISHKDIRVEVISSRVALCWMTTEFTPASGEPLDCPLFYSYRVPLGQEKGDWDFMVSDGQLEAFGARYPHFFEAEGAPNDMDGPGEFK